MKLRPLMSVLVVLATPALSLATIHTTVLSTPLVTPQNFSGGNSDGTGVWFNPLTGYSEVRGTTFPSPLFEDGKYFLVMDSTFSQTEAEVYTQGYFSRGNQVIGSASGNPGRFGDHASIGPGSSAVYTDLGPTFGNWAAGGHGYIGLQIRDASGTSASNVFYGYAEVYVNPTDFSTTLLSFAYNDVRGASITTTPEPATLGTIAATGLILARRRRA